MNKDNYPKRLYVDGHMFTRDANDYYRCSKIDMTLHRYLWKKHHGNTDVKDGHIIHHIDGNPSNNSIDNLVEMSHGSHRRLHHTMKKLGNPVTNFQFRINKDVASEFLDICGKLKTPSSDILRTILDNWISDFVEKDIKCRRNLVYLRGVCKCDVHFTKTPGGFCRGCMKIVDEKRRSFEEKGVFKMRRDAKKRRENS